MMVAISKSEFGIDIEKVKPIKPTTLKKALSDIELNEIYKVQNDDLRSQKLLKIWTIKESILKAVGTGLTIHPSKISINNNQGTLNNTSYRYFNIPHVPGFVGSIAMKEGKTVI